MTKVLKLAFLGRMQLGEGDAPLGGLVSGKARALLCYLAVNGRSHTRLFLAELLWPDMSEADALRNLRGVLMKLRQAIAPYLTITHQTVAFNHDSAHWLDVAEFKRGTAQSPVSNLQLEMAVSLYRGEFLEGFHVRQAPKFEAWVAQQRMMLQETAVTAYHTLASQYAIVGEYESGITAVRRLLALDPVRESGHRQLMELLAAAGQRNTALTQYEACCQILADELDVEPDQETTSLYEEIKSGQWQSAFGLPPIAPASSLGPQSFIAGPPVTQPHQFYGRQREIKRIFNLLQRLPLQNAAIIGVRRSGKTSLLHYLKTITNVPASQLRPGQRQDWLPGTVPYRWIFVDFQDPRLGECNGLLRYLLQQMQFPVADICDIDYFMDTVSAHLHSPTIILFDEIGVALERYPELDDAFWESLRSLATNQVDGNLAFILAAHEAPGHLAQHSGLGSPFFNIFGYVAHLGPLTESEARDLIASAPIPFSAPDVDWILGQSGRWPMPLQILCRERLLALEDIEEEADWREHGLSQMAPFLPRQADV